MLGGIGRMIMPASVEDHEAKLMSDDFGVMVGEMLLWSARVRID